VSIELLHRQAHLPGIQVTDQQLGTRRMQLLGQRVTHIAQALHRHPQAFQVVAAQAAMDVARMPANTPIAAWGEGRLTQWCW
jgi:hypothetical protein